MPNALSYTVQVSESPVFTTFVTNQITYGTTIYISGLSQSSRYYWRVIPETGILQVLPLIRFQRVF